MTDYNDRWKDVRKRPRGYQIVRQWKILKRLRVGATEGELAEEHQCSRRSIRRDLGELEAAGFPLYDEYTIGSGAEKVWRLVPGARLP